MCVYSQILRGFLNEVKKNIGSRKYIKRKDVMRIARKYGNLNMVYQMIDYYSKEKKYLTEREIIYIVHTCLKWAE